VIAPYYDHGGISIFYQGVHFVVYFQHGTTQGIQTNSGTHREKDSEREGPPRMARRKGFGARREVQGATVFSRNRIVRHVRFASFRATPQRRQYGEQLESQHRPSLSQVPHGRRWTTRSSQARRSITATQGRRSCREVEKGKDALPAWTPLLWRQPLRQRRKTPLSEVPQRLQAIKTPEPQAEQPALFPLTPEPEVL
jgi:hypothetical protein